MRGQSGQYLGCGVDGVDAHEGPGRVGPNTRGGDVDAHRAVAAAFDRGVRRFAEDREVTGQPVRVVAGDPAESVERGVDLLVVVEDPADVPTGLAQGRGRDELHGHSGLHIAGSAPPDHLVGGVVLSGHPGAHGRQVLLDGNGVEMTGDHDPLGSAEVGPGDDRIAVAQDLEVGARSCADRLEHLDDGIGQSRFVSGDGFDGAQTARELGRVIECAGQVPPELVGGREGGFSLSRWIDSHVP